MEMIKEYFYRSKYSLREFKKRAVLRHAQDKKLI